MLTPQHRASTAETALLSVFPLPGRATRMELPLVDGDGSTEQLALTYRRATKIADDEVVRVGDASCGTGPARLSRRRARCRIRARWFEGRAVAGHALATARDPRSVAAHELGHWIAFRQEGVTLATSAAGGAGGEPVWWRYCFAAALVGASLRPPGERLRPIAAGIGIRRRRPRSGRRGARGRARIVTRTQFVHLRGLDVDPRARFGRCPWQGAQAS